MYDSADYANTRIRATVVMYKRTPVYVLGVGRDRIVRGLTLVGGADKRAEYKKPCNIAMDDLNILNFPLGFYNRGTDCTYLFRRTLRRDWRQGLRRANVGSSNFRVDEVDIGLALMQRYPNFKSVLEQLTNKKCESKAWCPDFCMDSNFSIVWRLDVVGKLNDGIITLLDDFKFLKFTLEESINGHCKII